MTCGVARAFQALCPIRGPNELTTDQILAGFPPLTTGVELTVKTPSR